MSNKIKSSCFLFIGVLTTFIITGCTSSDTGNDSALGTYNIRQIVSENNQTSRNIMWQSKHKQAKYNIEFRNTAGKAVILPANDYSFKDGKGEYIQYGAKLSQLKPGSKYEYRINVDNTKGSWHSLETDNGTSFKALIFPDTQCSDYSVWQKLSKDAFNRNQDVKLFINMGDLTDNGEDNWQWQEWFKGVENYNDKIPHASVIGNHETYTLNWKVRYPKAYVNLFNVPENGIEKYKHQFYSFDYGPAHFTVLDTNYDKELKELQPTLRQEQLAWLEQDLSKSKSRWKIILMHKDILLYQFSKDSGRPKRWDTHFSNVAKDMIPIFEKHKVDAVLTAHLHTYRRRVPLLDYKPNPQGITYILTGVAGNVQYAKLWDNWRHDAARAPYPETMNYLTLTADNNSLSFKCYLPDGKQIDETTLKK